MSDYGNVNKSVKIDITSDLKQRVPQIFEDGKINLEKLKALLTGEIIEKEDDRFYFNWAGKSKLFKLIQEPGYGTLKPDKERSVDFDNTENIVIVGENLETLKLLLKPYFGKVKMIYIDPPYNTGKDLIYKDNFKEPLRDYLEKTGQIDSEGNKLTTNTEVSGRYHSDWLNFMYPRLFLARSLLRDDGVIFVSIDDHEVHNLRKIMDEIFGEENFIANISRVMKKGSSMGKFFSPSIDYIIVYAKDKQKCREFKEPLSEEYKAKYTDEDEKGKYVTKGLYQASLTLERSRHARYYIECPDGSKCIPPEGKRWRIVTESYRKLLDEDRIVFKKTKNSPLLDEKGLQSEWNVYTKQYLFDIEEKGYVPGNFLDGFPNLLGTKTLKELGIDFEFSKPIELIKYLIQLCQCCGEDIVIDFFAGSGTTGHAVWNVNKEDDGGRKFLLVQLDERVDPNSDIGKNAISLNLNTVADICIERLRRVSEKYKKEEKQKLASGNPDFGFKVLKLDKSNFNLKDEFKLPDNAVSEELKKKYLEWLGLWVNEPLVGDWKPIDVVYEVILKEGLDLNSRIEPLKMRGNQFLHVVDEKQGLEFYVSLDEKINAETIEEIRTAKYREKMFVFLDKALTDNDKINLSAFVNLKVI